MYRLKIVYHINLPSFYHHGLPRPDFGTDRLTSSLVRLTEKLLIPRQECVNVAEEILECEGEHKAVYSSANPTLPSAWRSHPPSCAALCNGTLPLSTPLPGVIRVTGSTVL